jgi:hypothetical protein
MSTIQLDEQKMAQLREDWLDSLDEEFELELEDTLTQSSSGAPP